MADFPGARNELDDFKCSANDCIHFRLVRHAEDMENDKLNFEPEMTHQVFGDSEMIFGYKDLDVRLFYTAANLFPYLSMSYKEMVAEKRHELPADDVINALRESVELPPSLISNADAFRAVLENDANFKPFGVKIDSYTMTSKTGDERVFDVHFTKIEEPGFRHFHERLQTFLKFFIDAASYIDVDDQNWNFFLLFERYEKDGSQRYAVAGYMTVYNFYAYPSCIRPRISQVLILPPFQKMGLGARLVQTFYNRCHSQNDILDITVEDPSENFQRIRDYVDATNCADLSSFKPEKLHKGFSQYMVHEARNKLKLSKLQSRRVYEILRLKATDENNPLMFREYRLDVKRRLNLPFIRNGRTFQKLERSVNPDELKETLGIMQKKQKYEFLEKAFQEDMEAYRHVIRRMALCNR